MKKYISVFAAGSLLFFGIIYIAYGAIGTIGINPMQLSQVSTNTINADNSGPHCIFIFNGQNNIFQKSGAQCIQNTTVVFNSFNDKEARGSLSSILLANGIGSYTYLETSDNTNDVCNSGTTLNQCRANLIGELEQTINVIANITEVDLVAGRIDQINETFYSYFLVLLNKLYPFIIGVLILLAVWFFGKRILNSFS